MPPRSEPRAVRVRVSGRVQGVGFRYSTSARAAELGLSGWVRNLVDGSVEAHLEGDGDRVQEMLDWLRRGPALARVDRLDALDADALGSGSFEVRPTASA